MCLPVCRPSVSSRGTTIGSSGGRMVRTSRSRHSPNESRSQRACRKNRWKLVWCFLPTVPAARSTLVTVCRCTHSTHPAKTCWKVANDGTVKHEANVATRGANDGASSLGGHPKPATDGHLKTGHQG